MYEVEFYNTRSETSERWKFLIRKNIRQFDSQTDLTRLKGFLFDKDFNLIKELQFRTMGFD